jgi:hypothetical protein
MHHVVLEILRELLQWETPSLCFSKMIEKLDKAIEEYKESEKTLKRHSKPIFT